VGFYSLLAGILTEPGGTVIAFEPVSSNAEKLRNNLALNQVSAEIIEAAVADVDGESSFARGLDSYTGRLSEAGDPVAVVSVDGLCNAGRLPLPNIMKIDVEGAEALVLNGALQTIRVARPIIFLAVHGDRVRAECLSLLASLGYQVNAIVGDGIASGSEFVGRPQRISTQ
jgi:FkbM family methyltransferase